MTGLSRQPLDLFAKVAAIASVDAYDLVGAILLEMSDNSSDNQSSIMSSDPKNVDDSVANGKSTEKSSSQKSHQNGNAKQDGGGKPSTSGTSRSRTRAGSSAQNTA